MNHVVRQIGGFDSQQKHIGQKGVRFTPVAKARQESALKFLLDNAFQAPTFMIRPEILRLIQPTGVVDRVRTAQNGIMNNLLDTARLNRLVEHAALDGATAYTPLQFLTDLRKGVWSELATAAATPDIYRRNLHRSFLGTIDNRLNGTTEPPDEVRALLRGELRALDLELQQAYSNTRDEVTKRHYQDARDEIATILDPRAMRERGGAAPAAGGRGRGGLR
jgi:hypothetical protein